MLELLLIVLVATVIGHLLGYTGAGLIVGLCLALLVSWPVR